MIVFYYLIPPPNNNKILILFYNFTFTSIIQQNHDYAVLTQRKCDSIVLWVKNYNKIIRSLWCFSKQKKNHNESMILL